MEYENYMHKQNKESIPDDISHTLCPLSHCTNAARTFCEQTVQDQIPTVKKLDRWILMHLPAQ